MNPSLTEELETMWGATAVPIKADELSVCGTSVSLDDADVAVAYDSKARRHLLLPFAVGERVVAQADWGALAFRAPRELLNGSMRRSYLDVVCKDPTLNSVFARLGAELVALASLQTSDTAARCIGALEHWRELFVASAPAFGREKTLGLLGELWVLRKLAALDLSAVAYWLGPLGAVHDFRNRTSVIEVKSSSRRAGRVVRVNGIEQLSVPEGGILTLFVLGFTSVPNGTLSLTSLLADIRALGVAQHQLDERLAGIGYREGEHPELERATFELREAFAYAVDARFPRIFPGSFVGGAAPDRVLRLEYDLDLTAEPPVPLSSAETDAYLKRFLTP